MRRLLNSVFCVAFSACLPGMFGPPRAAPLPPTMFVMVEPSADKFKPALDAALDEFTKQGSTVFRRDGVRGEGEYVLHVQTTLEGWTQGTARTNETSDGKVINLWPTIQPTWPHLPFVFVHELGHVLGLCHDKRPENIMYQSTIKAEHTLDGAVVDVLRAVKAGGNCP